MAQAADKAVQERELALSRDEILTDYRLALMSRQASLIGRREVFSGKGKFGIFGDGKEVPQVAMAHAWELGDWRSGYYRDQTLMFALGVHTVEEFFAQLYAHADLDAEPMTGGRSMNAHFATRSLNADGSWKDLTQQYNSSPDLSPTGSQMPRLVGLAYASSLFRELPSLAEFDHLSENGEEVAWGTVGNATCAEGMFWEAVNAVGVLQAPMVLSIWDDEYGISVPNEYQMTKQNISLLLQGFERDPGSRNGYDIYTVRGWDYPALVNVYRQAARVAREEHVPSIVHVIELTQPQGHSTSGSHERYKSEERLAWEEEYDCIRQMRLWILEEGLATEEELDAMEAEARREVEATRRAAWDRFMTPIREEAQELGDILEELAPYAVAVERLEELRRHLARTQNPNRKELMRTAHQALVALHGEEIPGQQVLAAWWQAQEEVNEGRYSSHLYSETERSALDVPEVKPMYGDDSPTVSGFEVLNAAFDDMLARNSRVVAFGEDLGYLGGVNQAFAGLQERYGPLRVSDTGIREATILGQAIGLALRGLRPIAEMQYLDYLLYALQIMSDDLATIHWRTRGGQKAPVIIRTRGHRLEGIWHSGSLMAGIIHLVRGVHVLVPRDMTRAAGFYNTLLQSDEPGLIVEVLNAYRLKEQLPDNIGEMTVPLGVPEILREGDDVTLVTYGAMCRIALEAAERLAQVDVEVEVIDVQSLLPFDIHGMIVESLKKTARIVFTDEDVPGGTTAYMMQEVLEKQNGYYWLDSEPRTLPGKAHRPAYGTDGDYWSKPNVESIFDTVYELMNEADPARYPALYE
ncbi:MAG: thiamine pyrophosphate-dependent enzyme [Candidatus Promineifilaceae bacterium]|nr:thiamine pyrophosphate-dependent enzyme [Candidatus Promineifilaceae bacterium]